MSKNGVVIGWAVTSMRMESKIGRAGVFSVGSGSSWTLTAWRDVQRVLKRDLARGFHVNVAELVIPMRLDLAEGGAA